jgi:ABC-type transporter Mla maintaining outer membrane lipid asymmetry permease subunit MlaE
MVLMYLLYGLIAFVGLVGGSVAAQVWFGRRKEDA